MRYLRILFVALLTMVAVLPAMAEDSIQATPADVQAFRDSIRRAPLVGAGALFVGIEDLKKDARADGLTTERIQTTVELRLRSAGIALSNLPSAPMLYVNVCAMKNRDGCTYSVYVSVEFKDAVMLKRDPKTICSGATLWDEGMIMRCEVSRLSSDVCETVSEMVDEFANDYLAANPKK